MNNSQTVSDWIKKWAEQKKISCFFYKKTSSTNDCAKEYVNTQKNTVLFIAEEQTKGRGRGKNKWLNSCMMLSFRFFSNKAPQPEAVVVMGQALQSALKLSWPALDFRLKPPNDIYILKKKAGGILIEALSKGPEHWLILGAGLNVLKSPAEVFTCLQEHLAKPITLEQWCFFMDNWFKEIKKNLKRCT